MEPVESVFVALFLFGALFTVASAALGTLGHHGGHDGAADVSPPGVPLAGQVGHDAAGHDGGQPPGHDGPSQPDAGAPATWHPLTHLRLLNLSTAVASLTWFGAAGFLLMRYAAWPALLATAGAVVAGLAGAILMALFLGGVAAGERVMDARRYRLPGTLARVTVSIPPGGIGEVVFSKGGARRSEAARSRSGQPIPRSTEVVILEYQRGVAAVEPWSELLSGRDRSSGLPAGVASLAGKRDGQAVGGLAGTGAPGGPAAVAGDGDQPAVGGKPGLGEPAGRA
jgi:hypothetical protein